MIATVSKTENSPTPEQIKATRRDLSFWAWMVGRRGGLKRWFNWLLLLHALIGFGLATVFKEDISDRARSVILPLAGILVGLTFAWAATAINIVSSTEFRRLMERSPKGGVKGVVNYFQLAILAVLASTVLWAIAGLGPFETPSWLGVERANLAAKTVLFGLTSFAITECWSAVNLTRLTLLAYNTVRFADEQQEAERERPLGP